MQYIVFYISSHGFGHLTRCLAICEEMLNTTDYNIYLVCADKQNHFAKLYLKKYSDRVFFRNINTDIGLINKTNSLDVDKELLEQELHLFVDSWAETIKKEYVFFKKMDIKAIISDISSIGILTAKELNVPVIKISNFTWLHQYEFLDLNLNLQNAYKDSYKGIDLYIEYDLALDHSFIKSQKATTGFITRRTNSERVQEIKKQFGDILFISCGKSANLPEILVNNFEGTIIHAQGIKIKTSANTYELPAEVLDTHNYVAASQMALVKAGWGSIAEGLVGHTPLVLMERDGVLEDSFMINELKKRELAVSISPDDMRCFDYSYWEQKVKQEINREKLNEVENSISDLTKIILKYI